MWCFCKESLDGMDDISTDLPFGVLVPIWQGKEGLIHLVVSKDRVGVSSHLTPLTCKPLDH